MTGYTTVSTSSTSTNVTSLTWVEPVPPLYKVIRRRAFRTCENCGYLSKGYTRAQHWINDDRTYCGKFVYEDEQLQQKLI